MLLDFWTRGLAVAFGSSYFCCREQIACYSILPPKKQAISTFNLTTIITQRDRGGSLIPVEYSCLLQTLFILFIGLLFLFFFLIDHNDIVEMLPGPIYIEKERVVSFPYISYGR
ncbi:hypothetical protein AAHE18_15G164400 [Arachis hypogaea]